MTRKIGFMILIYLIPLLLAGPVYGENQKIKKISLQTGVRFDYNHSEIVVNENEDQNINYSFALIEAQLNFYRILSLGIMVGYNSTEYPHAINFQQLPLSLQMNGETFHSVAWGVKITTGALTWNRFSLSAYGQMMKVESSEKEMEIQLPIVFGIAKPEASFTQYDLQLQLRYRWLRKLSLYLGPQVHFIDGSLDIYESVYALSGNQHLHFEQSKTLGLTTGINYSFSPHFELAINAVFFSKTGISMDLFITFE